MPFNVLLLPLLGGYFFISYWNLTRFNAHRYSGERLLFHSAAAGVIFLTISFGISSAFVGWFPDVAASWQQRVPFEYAGTSLLAFATGAVAWWPLNKTPWFEKNKQATETIRRWNDFLEVMLEYAERELKLVSVALKSRKVYIGFVTGSFDPMNDRKYIQLLPLQSGYRRSETLQLIITTDYSQVYNRIVQSEVDTNKIRIDNFKVVVPVSEIASINLFDQEAYGLFNPPPPEQSSAQIPGNPSSGAS